MVRSLACRTLDLVVLVHHSLRCCHLVGLVGLACLQKPVAVALCIPPKYIYKKNFKIQIELQLSKIIKHSEDSNAISSG